MCVCVWVGVKGVFLYVNGNRVNPVDGTAATTQYRELGKFINSHSPSLDKFFR